MKENILSYTTRIGKTTFIVNVLFALIQKPPCYGKVTSGHFFVFLKF